MNTALFNTSVSERLRSSAERAARGRDFGVLDVPLPRGVWGQLREEVAQIRPWPLEGEVEALILPSLSGALRCWPPDVEVSGSRIGWGEVGDPDGPTREGKR